MAWQQIYNDPTISPNFNELDARFDNYQIYSLAWCDQQVRSTKTSYQYGVSLTVLVRVARIVSTEIAPNTSPSFPYPSLGYTVKYYSRLTRPPGSNSVLETIDLQYRANDDINREVARALPSQSIVVFDPTGWTLNHEYSIPDRPISYQFQDVVTESITYNYAREPYSGNSPPLVADRGTTVEFKKQDRCITFQSFDVCQKIEQNFSQYIQNYPVALYPSNQANYLNLITGLNLDQRIMPDQVTFIAPFTGKISYSFYRKNIYETHPKVDHSLDYVHRSLSVVKNKSYKLELNNIVLGTLLADDPAITDLILNYTKANQYPAKYLFSQNIPELITYWNTLFPPIAPIDHSRDASNYTLTDDGVLPPNLVFERIEQVSTAIPVIHAANNDYWRFGGNTIDVNRVDTTHPIFNFDYTTLFETLQADNSYGTYTMDSVRLIEIHRALEADKYSTNFTSPGESRVTTLGWMIEAANRVLGLRFDDNGKINIEAETTTYQPATLNNPSGEGYGLTSWGTQGMFVSFLPTTYDENDREEKLWDVVHDIPQLIQAKERALNVSLGIQHGSQIRLRGIGGDVQSHPNQLALLLSMANKIERTNFIVQKLQIQNTVMGMEVRDLYSGIGIPVSTKFINLNNGEKELQVPYIGYQKDKLAMINHLTDLKINVAIALGAIMPKAQTKKTSVLNPFDKFNGG
jgi:hypothetical protein